MWEAAGELVELYAGKVMSVGFVELEMWGSRRARDCRREREWFWLLVWPFSQVVASLQRNPPRLVVGAAVAPRRSRELEDGRAVGVMVEFQDVVFLLERRDFDLRPPGESTAEGYPHIVRRHCARFRMVRTPL